MTEAVRNVVTKAELLSVLDRIARETAEDHAEAFAKREWKHSLEMLTTSLIWRTIALAIRQEIVPAGFDPKAGVLALGIELRHHAEASLADLVPSDDKADKYHKVLAIWDVLGAVLAVHTTMKNLTGRDPEVVIFLAVASTKLGQAEVELSFAEQGLWDQVARWKARVVGRPEGYTAPWRSESAPEINQWIADDPNIQRAELIKRLDEWLEGWIKTDRNRKRPQYESLAKLLNEMDKAGTIKLNKVPKKGK